jgi:hypothetical protein
MAALCRVAATPPAGNFSRTPREIFPRFDVRSEIPKNNRLALAVLMIQLAT